MMRLLPLFILLSSCCIAQKGKTDSFHLQVRFEGYKSVKTAWLDYYSSPDNDERTGDTVHSATATFSFKGTIPRSQIAYVWYTNEWESKGKMRTDTSLIDFFLVEGTTSITKWPTRSVIEGPQSVKDHYELTKRFNKKKFSIYMMPGPEITDTSRVSKEEQIEKYQDSLIISFREDIYFNYIKEHPDSELLGFALRQLEPVDKITADRYLALTDSLPEQIRTSPSVSSYRQALQGFKNSLPGMPFPELVQKDTLGKELSIRSFKGKIVLVDFWASWCIPCRKGHPELVKTYNRFKNKNFTIFSVALEDKDGMEQWKKAIRADGLTWSQGTDFKEWDNALAKKLYINSIPANILVNEDGIIIGKNLKGQELIEVLEKLLEK